ncbi:MAG TPA: protein kinase [Streptosporangiaceae bacterium]|nr:protein kinase [Streptosporangiaceae bacterium]
MSDQIPRDAGDFAPGALVAGYRLEEEIGRGGMAVVYRAHDTRLDRPVALKILAPELSRDRAFRQRFMRESRAAAAVDHPNIIPIFEAGEARGVLFIAMRYVKGRDLRTLLDRESQLPAAYVANVITQMASALDAAHARGLVHRDVKPANMLLDATGGGRRAHVYLSDFGLSKQALAAADLTSAGQFLGTLDYVAPEQIEGRPVDGRADLYALACAAFEMLCGTPPFERDQRMAVLWAQLSEPPPALTGRRPDLPAAVDQVMAKALAKAPADRYALCMDFAIALSEACGVGTGDAAVPNVRPSPAAPRTTGGATPRAGAGRSGRDPAAHPGTEVAASTGAAGPAGDESRAQPAQQPAPPAGSGVHVPNTPGKASAPAAHAGTEAATGQGASAAGSGATGDMGAGADTARGAGAGTASDMSAAAGTWAASGMGGAAGTGAAEGHSGFAAAEPSRADAGPYGKPSQADAGPYGKPNRADAGPYGKPNRADAGPYGKPNRADAGPYGKPSPADAGPDSGHATEPGSRRDRPLIGAGPPFDRMPPGPPQTLFPASHGEPPSRRRPWTRSRAVLVVACAAVVGLAGAALAIHAASNGTQQAALTAPGCSTATAGAQPLAKVHRANVALPGEPYAVAVTPNGQWTFVTLGQSVAVLRNGGSFAPSLVRTFSVPNANGESLTHDARYLVVASGSGAFVVNVAGAEQGNPNAVVGKLFSPGGRGAVQVAVSPDDRFAFVTLMNSNHLAVFDLHRALTRGFGAANFVGNVRLGVKPVGERVSSDGHWLYVTSEMRSTSNPEGTLTVLNLGEAEKEPGRSIAGTVNAGCDPVRVINSTDSTMVWVTARESNEVLGFSASRLTSDPQQALISRVRVGEEPIGLTFIDHGNRIVVANSNILAVKGATSSLMVINTAAAVDGRPALLGLVQTGDVPRQFAVEPNGRTLLVTDSNAQLLEAVAVGDLP